MTGTVKKKIAILPILLVLLTVILSVALKYMAFERYSRMVGAEAADVICDPVSDVTVTTDEI